MRFAEELADGTDVLELLRVLSDLPESKSNLDCETENRLLIFAILERILEKPCPSNSDLRAAVFLATNISSSHVNRLQGYWQLDQDLEQAGKTVREAEQTIKSKMKKFKAQEGGEKSGHRRNQQKCVDIDTAAMALIRLRNRDNSSNYTLGDIARELDHKNVSMAHAAKGGWPQRLKSLTKKVISARADQL